jgi:hypothetical protein
MLQEKNKVPIKARQRKEATINACIDLTATNSIAGQALDALSSQDKQVVKDKISKTLKKAINKNAKDVVWDVAHKECLEQMNTQHLTLSVVPVASMVHQLKPTMLQLEDSERAIKVGDYVEVLYEYAPGTCSDGGVGTIMDIHKDDADRNTVTVNYVLDKRIETRIAVSRIAVTMMLSFKDITSASRNRPPASLDSDNVVLMPDRVHAVPERSPLEWLEYGLKSRTHEKRGWLKEKLLEYELMEANSEALWKRVISDYKCQLSAIEGMRLALGAKFIDPREYKGVAGTKGKFVSEKKESQLGVPKNMWTIPFLLHAYDVKRSNFQNKRRDDKKGVNVLTGGLAKRVQYNKGDCVITNRVASRRKYTAKYFYSRVKALNPETIPVYKNPALHEDGLCRTREWNSYTLRVIQN